MKTLMKIIAPLFLFSSLYAYQGYNVVITTDPVLESTFLSQTTNQFNNTLYTNPFFPGTYQIGLLGLNPNYSQSVSSTSGCFPINVSIDSTTLAADLEALAAAGPQVITDPLVYGFASGMSYQQQQEIGSLAALDNLCASTTNFNLVSATTATWSNATCMDALTTGIINLYQLSLSTPTPLPVEP